MARASRILWKGAISFGLVGDEVDRHRGLRVGQRDSVRIPGSPYYLAPIGKGEKVYALLRETLLKAQRIGLARVVIQTRQQLAALVLVGPALVFNLLRWGSDIRPWSDLKLPAEGAKAAGLSERELAMAEQLVADHGAPAPQG